MADIGHIKETNMKSLIISIAALLAVSAMAAEITKPAVAASAVPAITASAVAPAKKAVVPAKKAVVPAKKASAAVSAAK